MRPVSLAICVLALGIFPCCVNQSVFNQTVTEKCAGADPVAYEECRDAALAEYDARIWKRIIEIDERQRFCQRQSSIDQARGATIRHEADCSDILKGDY